MAHEAASGTASGTKGLNLLRAKPVDRILSAINMPSMDGLEFLGQIRVQNLARGVSVVMITTASSEEPVKQAIEAGARGQALSAEGGLGLATQIVRRLTPPAESRVSESGTCAASGTPEVTKFANHSLQVSGSK
ncbi:MAG TPA: response regulator [Terracidiphilus sp.]|nr:response regulator [Terracidiphilus sp.]